MNKIPFLILFCFGMLVLPSANNGMKIVPIVVKNPIVKLKKKVTAPQIIVYTKVDSLKKEFEQKLKYLDSVNHKIIQQQNLIKNAKNK